MLHDRLASPEWAMKYPLHMPGHKRRTGPRWQHDITEIPGFDDLHHATGCIAELEEICREMNGAVHSKLSINGSTAGILAALTAVSERTDEILIGRQSHKSAYHGIRLNGLIPHYVEPFTVSPGNISCGYDMPAIDRYLAEHPQIGAMFFTSPTYEGVVLDVRGLADIAKRHGVILIIDEAHGAHFYRDPSRGALYAGADVVIQSLHKTLPMPTSTAVLHSGKGVDEDLRQRLDDQMQVFQTSSPSYLLMEGVSEGLELLIREGERRFRTVEAAIEEMRERLRRLRHLRLFEPAQADPYKIVLITEGTSMNGAALYDELYEAGFTLEMCTDTYVVAMLSLMDDPERLSDFVRAVEAVDETLEDVAFFAMPEPEERFFVPEITGPAFRRMRTEIVPYHEAEGRICAEPVYLYPPGVPILAYGERIGRAASDRIRRYREAGFLKEDRVRVIAEEP